jgi:ferredoxin-thioredoxin reductase catalytic subunit
MALIDAVRDATSLHDIDKDIFCPCKFVRDEALDVSPEVVASCNGGGR